MEFLPCEIAICFGLDVISLGVKILSKQVKERKSLLVFNLEFTIDQGLILGS